MASGRISRLSAFSDALKEDGRRRLSNTRTTDVEAVTIEDAHDKKDISMCEAPTGGQGRGSFQTENHIRNELNLLLPKGKVIGDVLSITASRDRETATGSEDERHFLFQCVKFETYDRICKILGEIIGTAILLLFACMGLIQWTNNSQPYFVGGFGFGLTIMFVIQVVGHISGAHVNPSVTLAALIYGKISVLMACMYVVAQFMGAIIGYGLLKLLTPSALLHPSGSVGTCSPSPNPVLSDAQVFFFEFFATTVLISMCCVAWDPRNENKQDSMAVKFGLATAIVFIAVSPATGCCINPARAFSPAMYNGDWELHWVYWLAPLLAAAVTTTIYKYVFYREAPAVKKGN